MVLIRVDVCICAFRRESLKDTLASIAEQRLADVELRVIVADNDEQPIRRDQIERLGNALGLNLHYVHAPACNISLARNACLDAATGDWIAFIDDDEVATPTWLSELLRAGNGRDIVFGVVEAVYPPNSPSWIIEGDFHTTRLGGNDCTWNGHTGNVLIKTSFVHATGLTFREAHGSTGGEDTIFFYEGLQAGAVFGYAPSAVVREPTDMSRTSLRWLLLRRFRAGQTHHAILRLQGSPLPGSLGAVAKMSWAFGAASLSAHRPATAVRHLLRGALHAGVVAAAIGIAPYREYRRASQAATCADATH
jgi:succinoglycan biosynthesis protein ExoM